MLKASTLYTALNAMCCTQVHFKCSVLFNLACFDIGLFSSVFLQYLCKEKLRLMLLIIFIVSLLNSKTILTNTSAGTWSTSAWRHSWFSKMTCSDVHPRPSKVKHILGWNLEVLHRRSE